MYVHDVRVYMCHWMCAASLVSCTMSYTLYDVIIINTCVRVWRCGGGGCGR